MRSTNQGNSICSDISIISYFLRYALELVKTNKAQDYYFNQKLPGILDQIQSINENRGEFFKKALSEIIQLEKQVKCQFH